MTEMIFRPRETSEIRHEIRSMEMRIVKNKNNGLALQRQKYILEQELDAAYRRGLKDGAGK